MDVQTKEINNFCVDFFFNFPHVLPCHGLGCAMTKAKLVYWSGTLFLFRIAKSRVSLAAFIP